VFARAGGRHEANLGLRMSLIGLLLDESSKPIIQAAGPPWVMGYGSWVFGLVSVLCIRLLPRRGYERLLPNWRISFSPPPTSQSKHTGRRQCHTHDTRDDDAEAEPVAGHCFICSLNALVRR
jgi:hypothetical protein